MRIGFALNLHWAIRLLNRFESGFSVDVPLDVYKAFDSVSHPSLLQELQSLNIPLNIYAWMNSSLFGHTQSVEVDNQTSAPTPVLSGIPQGSVLGLSSSLPSFVM